MADLSPFTLTIFGASGDLAQRKLLPAIYHLYKEGLLAEDFAVIGYARSEMSREDFIEKTRKSLVKNASDFSEDELWGRLSKKIHYVQGGYDSQEGFAALNKTIGQLEDEYKCHGNRVFHISTPPSVFDQVSNQLYKNGMAVCTPKGICSRIIIEKPFGHDLKSAQELNEKLGKAFLEKQIFRIDHYLGKETVQNILMLRFSNSLFESFWNNRYIDHVQITVAEDLGIEKRGSYYDTIGCVRDMVQNHLMQLLCICAMEPPNNIDSDEVRDEKVKVLKALRPFDLSRLDEVAAIGQYGPSADGSLKAYRQEEGVPKESSTETFAAIKMYVDNWRWMGTPFYLRTGKRMHARYSEIYLQFKKIPKMIFGNVHEEQPEGILIRIQPNEGVTHYMKSKVPGAASKLQSVALDFDYSKTFEERSADAYERLLYDAILDKPALFIRADETETSWAYFEPLLKHWEESNPSSSYPNYFAGSQGPEAADKLLSQDGRAWHTPMKKPEAN